MRTRSMSDGICLMAVALFAICGVYSFTRVADAAPVPKELYERLYDCHGQCDCAVVTFYGVKKKAAVPPPAVPIPDTGYEFVFLDGNTYTSTPNAITVFARCATGTVSNIDNSLYTYKYLIGGDQRCKGDELGQGDIPNGQNEFNYEIFSLNRQDAFGDPTAVAKNECTGN